MDEVREESGAELAARDARVHGGDSVADEVAHRQLEEPRACGRLQRYLVQTHAEQHTSAGGGSGRCRLIDRCALIDLLVRDIDQINLERNRVNGLWPGQQARFSTLKADDARAGSCECCDTTCWTHQHAWVLWRPEHESGPFGAARGLHFINVDCERQHDVCEKALRATTHRQAHNPASPRGD